MVGVLLFLAIAGLAIRVVYGLRRPHFWVFSGIVILMVLPLVVVMAVLGGSLHV